MSSRTFAVATVLAILLVAVSSPSYGLVANAQYASPCDVYPETCPGPANESYFENLPFATNHYLQGCIQARCLCTTGVNYSGTVLSTDACPTAEDDTCDKTMPCYKTYYMCLVFAARWLVIDTIRYRHFHRDRTATLTLEPVVPLPVPTYGPDEWAFKINRVTDLLWISPGFPYVDTTLYADCAHIYCTKILQPRNCLANAGTTSSMTGYPVEFCSNDLYSVCNRNPMPWTYRGTIFSQFTCGVGCVAGILVAALILGTVGTSAVCCIAWPSPRLTGSRLKAVEGYGANVGNDQNQNANDDYAETASEEYPWTSEEEESYNGSHPRSEDAREQSERGGQSSRGNRREEDPFY